MIFVTGASQGIGREIALTVAKENHYVALAARSDGINETAALCPNPERVFPIETDLRDEAAVRAAIDHTVDRFDVLDCLVNNAGIAGPTKPVEEVSIDEWNETMAVNTRGAFLTIEHPVEHLCRSNQASIINISSVSGKRPLEQRTPYVTSKMALIGSTGTVAYELGPDDITANAISPGPVDGPRLQTVVDRYADAESIASEEARVELFGNHTPLDGLATATDIAEMVQYLSSEHARHITAQDISVDSGMTWY